MTSKPDKKLAVTPADREGPLDTLIGYLLLLGVAASATLIAAGLLWHWARTGQLGDEYTICNMNLLEFTLDGIRRAVEVQFRPRLLISLGIAALLLTPYLRVLVSLVFFAFAERNWKYVIFTGFVLAVLTYSLLLR
jgi:uncharacterized membrane protein